jgi:hypothetical protein
LKGLCPCDDYQDSKEINLKSGLAPGKNSFDCFELFKFTPTASSSLISELRANMEQKVPLRPRQIETFDV